LSQPLSGMPSSGSYVNKRSSALHASVVADICLTSRLVRVTSCALSAVFHYGEKSLWFQVKISLLIVIVSFSPCDVAFQLWQLRAVIYSGRTYLPAWNRRGSSNAIYILNEPRFLNFFWTLNWGEVHPLRYVFYPLRSGFPFINNRIKLKYKVTSLVQKPRNKSYFSSVVCVINVIEWNFFFILY